VVALVAASLLAIAVPITRSHASARSSQPTAAGAAGDGLTLALQSQALAVAGALSQPGTANAAPAEYARQLQTLPAHDLLPQELLTAVSRAAAGGVLDSGHPGSRAVAQPPVPFTVHTSGLTTTQTSSKTTVGEALREIGVQVDEHDAVRPPQDARLTPGLNIYVSYATSVYLTLEGKERLLRTQADTVGGVLSEQGLTLEPADRIYPAAEKPVHRGMSINVVTVRENVEFTDDPIAYDRLYE